MSFFRLRSLQARLQVLVISVVCAMWLGAVALTLYDASHEVDEILDSNLAQVASLLVYQQLQITHDEHFTFLTPPLLHKYAPKMAYQVYRDQTHGGIVKWVFNRQVRPRH
jgi:two-component system sensor histidine kinase QseC